MSGQCLIDESAVTQGVINAMLKRPVRVVCAACGFPVPKYPGRYPKNCPSCGEVLPEKSEE
jgi:hypothetical protein